MLLSKVARAAAVVLCIIALTSAGHASAGLWPTTEVLPSLLASRLSPSSERPSGLTDPEPLVRTSQDLLRLCGMDETRLGAFDDHAPVDDDTQRELVLRMFLAVRKFSASPADLIRYTTTAAAADFGQADVKRRGELIKLAGKVVRVTAEHSDAAVTQRFELPVIYRCEVMVGETQRAVIYARQVPKPWRESESEKPLDERIGARAFYVRHVTPQGSVDQKDAGQDKPTPVFVTDRVAWYPQTPLGDLDADAGLFETVTDNTELGVGDSACFFDMLSANGRVLTNQLFRFAQPDFPVEKLFRRRNKQTKEIVEPTIDRGQLIVLSGTAQRAIKLRIEDPDTIAAYGFDHYYEIELWHGSAQGNPIVFCVRQLPAGMPLGERIAVDIRAAGFFFKTWAYPIDKPRPGEDEKRRFQLAPLFIGREPQLIIRESTRDPRIDMAAGGLFLIAAIGAWIGVWWSQREDKRFHDRVVRRVMVDSGEVVTVGDLSQLDQGPLHFREYSDSKPLLGNDEAAIELPQVDTNRDTKLSPPRDTTGM